MGFCQRCTKQSWRLWVSVNVAQNNVGVYGFLLALHKTMLVFMGFCQRCTKQGTRAGCQKLTNSCVDTTRIWVRHLHRGWSIRAAERSRAHALKSVIYARPWTELRCVSAWAKRYHVFLLCAVPRHFEATVIETQIMTSQQRGYYLTTLRLCRHYLSVIYARPRHVIFH